MGKLILNRFFGILCYLVPIAILLVIYRDNLFKTNENSFTMVFSLIVGGGALWLIYALGIHKIKSIYVLVIGGLLAWLLNTKINTSIFYLAPLLIGSGAFIEEVFLRPAYKRIVITVKGDKK